MKRVSELNVTQEGAPAAIPVEACYLGWQESLTLLGKLVETEIPDEPQGVVDARSKKSCATGYCFTRVTS